MISETDKLQKLLDDLGADVSLEDPNIDLDIDQRHGDSTSFIEVNVTKPVLALQGEEPVDLHERRLLDDGSQFIINVSKRPRCPNCGYIPTQEGDSARLTGECGECGNYRCSNCSTECSVCNRLLCKYCSDGYPERAEGEVLCPKHRRDIERERKFEAQMQIWELDLREETQLLEEERKRDIAEKELVFDIEMQRKQQKLDEELQRRKQRLEEFKASSKHLDREAERRLEEKQMELDAAENRLEYELEVQKQELESEIKKRNQRLEEYETVTSQLLEARGQDLDEREFELEAEVERRRLALEEMEADTSSVHDKRMNRLQEWEKLIDVNQKLGGIDVPEITDDQRRKASQIVDIDYDVWE